MTKIKLFLDFDGVIVDSMDAACKTYNRLYQYFDGFVPAEADKCQDYNMLDVCPLRDGDAYKLFSETFFFENLRFTQEDVPGRLREISENYEIIVTSLGTAKNIELKVEWIKENLPMIEKTILLTGFQNKEIVNMAGGVIVDDHRSNLERSNADFKIVFGKIYPWNKTTQYNARAYNFDDLSDILDRYRMTRGIREESANHGT